MFTFPTLMWPWHTVKVTGTGMVWNYEAQWRLSPCKVEYLQSPSEKKKKSLKFLSQPAGRNTHHDIDWHNLFCSCESKNTFSYPPFFPPHPTCKRYQNRNFKVKILFLHTQFRKVTFFFKFVVSNAPASFLTHSHDENKTTYSNPSPRLVWIPPPPPVFECLR